MMGRGRPALARRVAFVALGSFALVASVVIVTGGLGPPAQDIDNYWGAAMRLRANGPLYIDVGDPNAWYSYAPWFAWLWVPLTYLPLQFVTIAWMVLCLLAWSYMVWHLRTEVPLLLLVGPLTLYGAWVGNVQPLMIAALLRWRAPVTVGVLASIKVSPILLALVWLGRREWRKVGVALSVAAILVLPVFLYDLRSYPLSLSEPMSPWYVTPALGLALTVLASVAALVLARSRFAWLSAANAVLAARPSLLLYDVGWLLVAIPRREVDR